MTDLEQNRTTGRRDFGQCLRSKKQFSENSGQRSIWIVVGLGLVVALGSVLIFNQLGRASFFGDESIYTCVAREALEIGEWFPFHTSSGNLYLDKPPVKIWMTIAGFRLFGEGEFFARFPDAVFALLTVAIVYLVTSRRFGVLTGLVAAFLLLAAKSFLILHGARDAVMDTLLTLLALGLCVAWCRLRQFEPGARGWWLVATCVVVIANLVKHLMGVMFAGAVVLIEVVWWGLNRRKPRSLIASIALFGVAVAGGVAYFLVANHATEGRFAARLYSDIVVRATTGLAVSHLHGPFFYLERLARDFGPWLFFVIPAAFGIARTTGDRLYRDAGVYLGWAFIWIGVFSIPVSKLPWYIYPSYPALSLVIAVGVHHSFRWIRNRSLKLLAGVVVAVVLVVDLHGAWRAVARDRKLLDAERFVRAYSRLGSARLFVDAPSIEEGGRLRSWNRFYLEGADNVTWFDEGPVLVDINAADCVFVATGDLVKYWMAYEGRWQTIMKFRKHDRVAGDIWIIGTCELEVPRALQHGLDRPPGLISTTGFERGFGSSFQPATEEEPIAEDRTDR